MSLIPEVASNPLPESKTKRSSRRFKRRLASLRRKVMRQLHADGDVELTDAVGRIPTRQEKRISEAFEQDLSDLEYA